MKKAFYLLFILFIIIGISSCLRPRLKVEMKSISRFTWRIVYVTGKKIDKQLYPEGLPFVNFTEDGIISGSTGCNGFGGKVNLSEENIAISDLNMELRGCAKPRAEVEDGIIQGLNNSNRLFQEGNTLIFMKDDEELLRLKDN